MNTLFFVKKRSQDSIAAALAPLQVSCKNFLLMTCSGNGHLVGLSWSKSAHVTSRGVYFL